MSPTAPIARKTPHSTTIHGLTLTDDYHWLRGKDDPAVIAYLEAENVYTTSVMAHLKPLEDRLYSEMLGRIKQADLSVPARKGEYWYYSRTEEGKQYPYLCGWMRLMAGELEGLLGRHALAEGQRSLRLGTYGV